MIRLDRITIHNVEFEVKPLNQLNTNYSETKRRKISLPVITEPEDSAVNKMDALNDDCLGLIFEKLNFANVLSVVKVCKRFKRVLEENCSGEFRRVVLDELFDRQSIQRDLPVFGPLVYSASLRVGRSGLPDPDFFLKKIAKYCTNLRSFDLQIDWPDIIQDQTVIECQPFFFEFDTIEHMFNTGGCFRIQFASSLYTFGVIKIGGMGRIQCNQKCSCNQISEFIKVRK